TRGSSASGRRSPCWGKTAPTGPPGCKRYSRCRTTRTGSGRRRGSHPTRRRGWAWEIAPMSYIDPHIHMISRVTDDYQRMAQCGCVAVSEPAFWAGFDRGSAAGFRDYFHHLTEVEPKRAAQFGIRHYSWLCIHAKEAENVTLSREVIALIPEYLNRPNVLGIGEIGLNKNTRNEATIFQEHVDVAMKTNELILIHTPHLEDKYKGTRMIIDMLRNDRRVNP